MKPFIAFVLIIFFSVLYLYLYSTGTLGVIVNQQSLQEFVLHLDVWGPLLVILIMSGAIVMSPIPSAPIALASGAAYGHTWGTIYVLIGAEIGAIMAFTIARLLGNEVMHRRFGDRINIKWLQSENNLMLVVGLSRLLPFISFDIVSYAAGLTSLSYWRFALATLLGIIPASFLLAHFGSEVILSDLSNMIMTVLLLGGITGIPLLIGMIIRKYMKKTV